MNGFLLIDKPVGITSNDVLNILKRKIGIRKLGHTGTLDPFATGLLVVGIGEALKFIPYLNEEPKVYEATLKLGIATDTLDSTGTPIEEKGIPSLNPEKIKEVLKNFLGKQTQVPPMYSAKKKEGKKLYELARAGIEVERKPVDIEIFELFQIPPNPPLTKGGGPERGRGDLISFRVSCSRGTYIRVLGADIATALGTVGHLTALRRLRAGPFSVEQGVKLDDPWECEKILWPISRALKHLSSSDFNADEAKELSFGRSVPKNLDLPEEALFLLKKGEEFLGIGIYRQGQILPKRLMKDTTDTFASFS